MFPPWAPFFRARGGTRHCCAEQAPLRDDGNYGLFVQVGGS